MSNGTTLISFVVPVLNEEDNIRPFYERVTAVMKELSGEYRYEIVFTDNHSTDKTFAILRDLAEHHPEVRVIRFSRNFGYQKSIFTGYTHARGDVAIQLDCDLQDPPELVPEFLRLWRDGHDVVYGVRITRAEGWWISFMRRLFYWLIDRLSETTLPRGAGDFRLVSRRILDELSSVRDEHIYLRGVISALGFRQIGVDYERPARVTGQTKFSLFSLFGLAFDGIVSHSIVPLRLATFVGLLVALLTFFGLIAYAVARLFYGEFWPPGFATTTVLQLLGISLNAMFFGIIGEYLGRIYGQVKNRPLTVIEATVNMTPDADT